MRRRRKDVLASNLETAGLGARSVTRRAHMPVHVSLGMVTKVPRPLCPQGRIVGAPCWRVITVVRRTLEAHPFERAVDGAAAASRSASRLKVEQILCVHARVAVLPMWSILWAGGPGAAHRSAMRAAPHFGKRVVPRDHDRRHGHRARVPDRERLWRVPNSRSEPA